MLPNHDVPHGRIVPVIDPNAVFDLQQARQLLGLAKNTLGREIRLGRLRCSKRAGKCFVLGSWLLEWIQAGEIKRGRKTPDVRRLA